MRQRSLLARPSDSLRKIRAYLHLPLGSIRFRDQSNESGCRSIIQNRRRSPPLTSGPSRTGADGERKTGDFYVSAMVVAADPALRAGHKENNPDSAPHAYSAVDSSELGQWTPPDRDVTPIEKPWLVLMRCIRNATVGRHDPGYRTEGRHAVSCRRGIRKRRVLS